MRDFNDEKIVYSVFCPVLSNTGQVYKTHIQYESGKVDRRKQGYESFGL